MTATAGTEAARTGGRRSGRWLLLATAFVAVVVAVLTSGSGRAGADGFLIGCPAGPDSELGAIHLLGINIQHADPNLPPTQIALVGPAILPVLTDPSLRELDTDLDGVADLRWSLELGPDLSQTNLIPLWQRLGGALDATNTSTAIRVSFDRLATDLDVAPYRITGGAVFDLVTPDPNDPNAPPVSDATAVNLGYDTRVDGGNAPTHWDATVVLQDAPPVQPDTGYLGARLAAEYRSGGDPTAALVAPGSEPPLTNFVLVGSWLPTDDLLDLNIDYDRMPAQFAFVDATTCTGPTPNRTFAWDDRDEQIGVPDDTVAPTSADIDLYVGKVGGVAGKPEFHLDGRVESLPEEMTGTLTENNIRLFHQQHPGSGGSSAPSTPAPDLTVDELLVTAKGTVPGEPPTRLRVTGFVHDLPPTTNVDVTRDATGGFREADLRFCDNTWGSNECNDTLGTVGEIGLIASDLFAGDSTGLPALSLNDGPIVAYTSRDVGGNLIVNPEKRFRFAVRMPGVRHVHIGPPVVNTLASATVTYDLAAPVPSARVRFDVDNRHTDLGQNFAVIVKGSKLGLNGTLTPVPARANFAYTSTDAQPFNIGYQLFNAQAVFDASFSYRGNTANKLMQLDGRGQLGDVTQGMPSKATLVYTAATTPGATERVDYSPSSPTRLRVGLVMSNSEDRALGRRLRLWGDATLGTRVIAEWRRSNDSLRHFELRPCDAPCAAGTLLEQASARVVYSAPLLGEVSTLLSAPPLPSVAPSSVYPAFTTTPYGITYVEPEPNLWGARAVLAKLQRVRYDYPGVSVGRKVCVESAALPATVTDKRFGTHVFVGSYLDRKGEPVEPFYLDGVLTQLPLVLDARINEEGAAKSQTIPWLWIDQRRCDGTTLPTKGDKIEPTGVEFRAFARFGAVAAHEDMISDPIGKAPIALSKPTGGTPLGIVGHVFSDSVNGRTAGDIAGRVELPPQLVVFRPLMSTCNDSTPPVDIGTCQSLPMYSRAEKTQFRMKLLGTIDEYGAADILVRLRGHNDRNDPDAPVAPDACTPPPGGGQPLCDMDITGRLDHIPGMVELVAHLNTNRRVPTVDMALHIDTLVNPAAFPTLDHARITVLDDAHPAFVGAGSNHPRVANYDVDLTGLEHAIEADLVFQGNESLPSHNNVCPERGFAGRGPMGVDYVHAQIDVGDATDLVARARIDDVGRFQTELRSNQPINGTVNAKAKNIGFGYKDEILTVFDTSDIDLCIDVDLPFQIDLQNTTTACLGIDLATWVLEVPPASSEKMTLQFGERLPSGTWLPGGRWIEHYAHFNPEGPGDWVLSTPGRRNVMIMPEAYWGGVEMLNYFDDEWALANKISTGKVFNNDDAPGCCVTGGKTYFTLDLFWNQEIRDDMYCRDRPACHPDFLGRPGLEFHHAIWDRGHMPPTGTLPLGNLTNVVNPPASASFNLTASGNIIDSLDVETAQYHFKTPSVQLGEDGTRYRIYMGPAKGTPGFNVSLGAEYDNGTPRWRRQVTSYTPSRCLIGGLSCTTTATLQRLPSGLLLLDWKLKIPNGTFTDTVTGQLIFDPSGYGGPPSTLWVGMDATAGQPTVFEHPTVLPGFDVYETKKVVYLGDGTVVDQGTSVGAVAPVADTYAFPGNYPGVVVYYYWQGDRWKSLYNLPFEMHVAPPV